jgi:hypothetical protein
MTLTAQNPNFTTKNPIPPQKNTFLPQKPHLNTKNIKNGYFNHKKAPQKPIFPPSHSTWCTLAMTLAWSDGATWSTVSRVNTGSPSTMQGTSGGVPLRVCGWTIAVHL